MYAFQGGSSPQFSASSGLYCQILFFPMKGAWKKKKFIKNRLTKSRGFCSLQNPPYRILLGREHVGYERVNANSSAQSGTFCLCACRRHLREERRIPRYSFTGDRNTKDARTRHLFLESDTEGGSSRLIPIVRSFVWWCRGGGPNSWTARWVGFYLYLGKENSKNIPCVPSRGK